MRKERAKRNATETGRNLYQSILMLLEIDGGVDDPEPLTAPLVKALILMATAMGVILIISNLAALKIWRLDVPWPESLWPLKFYTRISLPVDAGILLFPFSYAIGDLLVEIFGKKVANLVAVYSAGFALAAAVILLVARYGLPDYPGADNSGFVVVQDAAGRIFVASVLGFLISQIVNNHIFSKLRELEINGDFSKRAIISSIVARVFDVGVFEVLAFLGILSLREFWRQAIFAYLAGVVIELMINKPTKELARHLTAKYHYTDGKIMK